MDTTAVNNINILDRIRTTSGIESLKKYFQDLLRSNKKSAILLINEDTLQFTSLFVLQSDIKQFNLLTHLNERNQTALEIADGILAHESSSRMRISGDDRSSTYPVVKWMLETGYEADGLNNQFDQIIESSAILLAQVYKDMAVLPRITDLIFNRYRKGHFIYDLVWSFFECRDPQSLTLIATRLCSVHPKDVELARKLLCFIPGISWSTSVNPIHQYSYCVSWIHENNPFLNYTGEGFQQTSNPMPYIVSFEAKYLCRSASTDYEKFSRSLTTEENTRLHQFKQLDEASKQLLSSYSYRLHRQNYYIWRKWLTYPLVEQLRIARSMGGGLL